MLTRSLVIMLAILAASNNKGCVSSTDIVKDSAYSRPPQTAKEKQELEEILTKWEQATAVTENYRYEFRRWEYDPVFGPKNTFKTYSEGVIEISMPDSWYIRIDKVLECQRPWKSGEEPHYAVDDDKLEESSYDGSWLTYADSRSKTLSRSEVPPNSRHGLGFRFFYRLEPVDDDSTTDLGEPLRWLASIDRKTLKQKYRLRLLASAQQDKETIRIEAIPKKSGFLSFTTIIILDRELCLPIAGILFDSPHSPSHDQGRTVYEFTQGDPRIHECAGFVISQVEPIPGWIVCEHRWHVATNSARKQKSDSTSANLGPVNR